MVRTRILFAFAAMAGTAGLVRADDRLLASNAPETEVEQTFSSLEREEGSLRAELDGLGGRGKEAQRRLLARGRLLYRLARVGILPVGAGLGSLFEHASKVERTRRALEQDLSETRAISDRKIALLRKLGEVTSQKGKLKKERDETLRASAALDDPLSLEPALGQRGIQMSFSGAPAPSAAGREVRAGPSSPPDGTTDGFKSMKGRLPLPLAGRADLRRVRRPGASGPGLEMVTAAGTAVRAVFSGRVAFADRYDPFGSVVILDHGDHFYTLMGDLTSMDVRVGDELSAGARIGTAGTVLYFEIRRGSSTVDPGPWLGL